MASVYALVCPVSKKVRYIGCTIRSLEKRREAHLGSLASYAIAEWLDLLRITGDEPKIVLITKCNTFLAKETELSYIKYYAEKYKDFLLNSHGNPYRGVGVLRNANPKVKLK